MKGACGRHDTHLGPARTRTPSRAPARGHGTHPRHAATARGHGARPRNRHANPGVYALFEIATHPSGRRHTDHSRAGHRK